MFTLSVTIVYNNIKNKYTSWRKKKAYRISQKKASRSVNLTDLSATVKLTKFENHGQNLTMSKFPPQAPRHSTLIIPYELPGFSLN